MILLFLKPYTKKDSDVHKMENKAPLYPPFAPVFSGLPVSLDINSKDLPTRSCSFAWSDSSCSRPGSETWCLRIRLRNHQRLVKGTPSLSSPSFWYWDSQTFSLAKWGRESCHREPVNRDWYHTYGMSFQWFGWITAGSSHSAIH